jgi:tetratricopeptide (TPR) repeat protein
MDNIQKLREKVDRDPKSTVFVRLADELKRAGRVDEAVEVLKTGIENQPGYMSARVALGKIFMEKEMADEAKAEFMQVVEAVPDNLFARKKLAEIYRSEGDVELALEHYKQYLSMSPQDEEVQAICAELENAPVPQANRGKSAKEEPLDASERPSPLQAGGTATAAPAPAGQPTAEKVPEEADIDAEDVYLETSPYEEDEAEGFLSTLTDKDVEAETVNADEVSLSLRDKEGDTSGHGVEFKGFELEAAP